MIIKSFQAVQLMGIDLLRQQPKWKDILIEIRQLISNLNEQVIKCIFFTFFLLFLFTLGIPTLPALVEGMLETMPKTMYSSVFEL